MMKSKDGWNSKDDWKWTYTRKGKMWKNFETNTLMNTNQLETSGELKSTNNVNVMARILTSVESSRHSTHTWKERKEEWAAIRLQYNSSGYNICLFNCLGKIIRKWSEEKGTGRKRDESILSSAEEMEVKWSKVK